MTSTEFKAMISLLDDLDPEISKSIENSISKMGMGMIEKLELELEQHAEDSIIYKKIKQILRSNISDTLLQEFLDWNESKENDLLTGLWLISRIEFPDTRLELMQAEINRIFLEVWVKTRVDMHPEDLLISMNDVIFNQLGFQPDVEDFYSIEHSFFNKVLEKKRGNPVMLSCLYMLLASRLQLPLYGVNLPFLFITVVDYPGCKFYVNAFNEGKVFTKAEIKHFLKQLNIVEKKEHFSACSNQDIIRRILNNLQLAYIKMGNPIGEKRVTQIIKLFA